MTLRPNAVASDNVAYVNTGGAGSKDAAVADNSDATYLDVILNAATMALDLGTFAFGTATIYSVTIRARGSCGAGTVTPDSLAAYAKVAGTRGASGAAVAATGSVNVASSSAMTTRPGGGAWTQADIDALQVELEFFTGDLLPDGQAMELYADVVYG